MNTLTEALEARYIPEPTTGCYLWLGAWNGRYGNLWWDGKMQRAHMLAWVDHHKKPVPPGLHVLHKCDLTACVRPDHLFLGTHQQNMTDKVAKGRQARGPAHGLRGEAHPSSTISDDDVVAIRKAHGRLEDIGRPYSLSPAAVSLIKNYKSHRYIPPSPEDVLPRRSRKP